MTAEVAVQVTILDQPLRFEFETDEQARTFMESVRNYGLHLNVDSARMKSENGDQEIGAGTVTAGVGAQGQGVSRG